MNRVTRATRSGYAVAAVWTGIAVYFIICAVMVVGR